MLLGVSTQGCTRSCLRPMGKVGFQPTLSECQVGQRTPSQVQGEGSLVLPWRKAHDRESTCRKLYAGRQDQPETALMMGFPGAPLSLVQCLPDLESNIGVQPCLPGRLPGNIRGTLQHTTISTPGREHKGHHLSMNSNRKCESDAQLR